MTLFRDGEGRLPKDLAEVFARKLPTGRSDMKDLKEPTDLYQRPMLFKADADGRRFTVTSLGRDGKPGGSGPDADVVARDAASGSGK